MSKVYFEPQTLAALAAVFEQVTEIELPVAPN
jgi:hypothetical protein